MATSASQKIIDEAVSNATGEIFITEKSSAVAGGCINSASLITSGNRRFFLKTNSQHHLDMFVAEADGLLELRKPGVIRLPEPVCYGETGSGIFLVLEYLLLSGGTRSAAEALGAQLAKLHQQRADRFGWSRNNTIGATQQINTQLDSWVEFYRERRLVFQLSLAAENGFGGELQKLGASLCDNLDSFFDGYQPYPALLHGDLWSGNVAYTEDGLPVIFDPAIYYGDREADIAMTELFGGFPASFYASYNDVLPLDDGYALRKNLYNLYHILNHLNLFGSGYQSQAICLMKRLLSNI